MINILLVAESNKSHLAENELSNHRVNSIDIGYMIDGRSYDEEIHKFIEKNSDEIKNSQLIIIDDSDYDRGFCIINHLRFGDLRNPAIMVCELTEDEIFRRHNYRFHKGTMIIKKDDLSQAISENKVINLKNELEYLYKNFKDEFLYKLIIKGPEQQGRHSVANQWGAYRMAEIGGLKIEYSFPKTLYFKNLIALSSAAEPINLQFPIVNKILLIDDNCNNGWSSCLKVIFGSAEIKEYVSWNDATLDGVKEQIMTDQYDMIFLDYYLDEGERIDRIGKGKNILKEIKGSREPNGILNEGLNPVIPVIMFTASNKAWNMDELYEAGADGYYIKEHPETAHDPEFSIENFKNFHKTVSNCLKKGNLLRKYWNKIKDVQEKPIFQDKDPQLNKERISERLKMFLGLLKKAFEQTEFDKNTFFYSEWELAFLTLWSVLNEVQEALYVKTQPILSLKHSNMVYTQHPNGKKITYFNSYHTKHFKWTYEDELFLDYDYKIIQNESGGIQENESGFYSTFGTRKSPLEYNNKNGHYSLLSFSKNRDFKYEEIMHLQIAFLLLKNNADKNLLINLDRLNKVRNKLYLTHGEDSSSQIFKNEYKNQRQSSKSWEININNLFEIVHFLCTGDERRWDKPQKTSSEIIL